MQGDYAVLRNELLNDPLALGYGPLTDQAAADKLNALNTGRTRNKTAVSKNEVLRAIVDSEWPTTALNQNKLLVIFSCDNVDASNTNVRAVFASIFGPATTTRANLLALGSETISRATELNLFDVGAFDVQKARSGVW